MLQWCNYYRWWLCRLGKFTGVGEGRKLVNGGGGGERLRGLVEERWSCAKERGIGNGEKGEEERKEK